MSAPDNVCCHGAAAGGTTQRKGDLNVPTPERPPPLFAQIASYLRDAILNGDLSPGERLPAREGLAEEWGVSYGTIARAVTQLQVEGVVYTNPQGSFVATKEVVRRTPGDRIKRTRPVRMNGDSIEVTAAEIVTAPNYVADLLGIDIGSQVIRREEITHSKDHPRLLSVDWIPGFDVTVGERLTEKAPIQGGTIAAVESLTGRRVTYGEDHIRSRSSDAREAAALRLPVGAPILAGVHLWSDGSGVLLYGEWVMPPDQVISYEYCTNREE